MLHRFLQLFKRRKLNARAQAIRDGRIVEMQRPPFRQFIQILNCDFPLAMTKAAFEQFVRLPGEPKRKAAVPANFRWGIIFLTLVDSQQKEPSDANEALFDVNVMMPDGFQVPKTLEVVSVGEGENKGFIFMLPDEESITLE